MDEYLESSNNDASGGSINDGTKVAPFAFVDDTLFLDDQPERMAISLNAKDFLEKRGMVINTNKCYSITTYKLRGNLRSIIR